MLLTCVIVFSSVLHFNKNVADGQAQAQSNASEHHAPNNVTYLYREGDQYFFMPDADGVLHLCDARAPPDPLYLDSISKAEDLATFLLYTRLNQYSPQYLRTNDSSSVQLSNFDLRKDTKVLVHGWRGSASTHMNTILRKEFLLAGDVNIIIVDYKLAASGAYFWATAQAGGVARSLARLLRFVLGGAGAGGGRLHLVGHSLGGHVVGIAGRELGGQAERITGLDPALPLWGALSGRLRRTDAQYVEVIHTNAKVAGQAAALGHADFYPNGGSWMPGCGVLQFGCSHGRSYRYFAESLRSDRFVGRRCRSVPQAMRSKCAGADTATMGSTAMSKEKKGVFSLHTNAEYPYARG